MTNETPPSISPFNPLDYIRDRYDLHLYVDEHVRLAVAEERERCRREISRLFWMSRVPGRWDQTDAAYAEGFNNAKTEALLALGPTDATTEVTRADKRDAA